MYTDAIIWFWCMWFSCSCNNGSVTYTAMLRFKESAIENMFFTHKHTHTQTYNHSNIHTCIHVVGCCTLAEDLVAVVSWVTPAVEYVRVYIKYNS